MIQRIPFIDKLSMALLLLAPILGIYGNPDGWSYDTLLTLPLSFFYFLYYFSSKGSVVDSKNPLSEGLALYFIYWGVILAVFALKLPLIVIQAYLAFFLFYATFHLSAFVKMYKLFALLCIGLFIAQEITYYVTGVRISGFLSFLPSYSGFSASDMAMINAEALRSSSFFSEPAHFAQFLLPLFAIELYYDNKRYHFVYAALIGGTLLLLRSGNGIVGMAAILMFAFSYFKHKSKKTKWIMMLLFVFVVALAGFYYLNSEMGESIIGRQAELSSHYEGGSRSGFLRVWRGFYVFDDYNVIEKIIGCPNEKVQLNHVTASGMLMVSKAELYFNAFQKILLNTGFIGVAIFVYVIVRLWRGNSICGKAILCSLIALSFVAAIYMSFIMILHLVLAQSMKRENDKIIK